MPFIPTDAFPVDLLPTGEVDPLVDLVWTGYHGDTVTIPKGRRSDLGTVPRLLRAVLPHDGPAARGFLVHDELCRLVHAHQAALDAWRAANLPTEGADVAVLAGLRAPRPPAPLAFDAVDTDAVLRVILAELGVGPVRWIYWEGVRLGALGSKGRRRGWLRPRSVLPFLLLALPSLVVVLPGAVGAAISWVLLKLAELACWPWERRARRERVAKSARVRRIERGRETIRRGAARAKSRESATRTEGQVGPGVAVPDPGSFWRCFLCGDGGSPAESYETHWRDRHEFEARPDGVRTVGEVGTTGEMSRSGADRIREAIRRDRGEFAPNRPVTLCAPESSESASRTGDQESGEGWQTWIDTESIRCTCHAGWEGVHDPRCPVAPRRIRRALAAPFRLAWRGLCAVGRGIANVLYALLEAL